MTYNVLNPPAIIGQRVGANGGAMWIYKDGDSLADVNGINYITNATDLGLKAGDCVMLVDETDNTITNLTVTPGQTPGTAVGATGSAIEPIGETSIALASAGTGTFVIGDIALFDGDATEYLVTAGDTDVSDGGTITITPGLVLATLATTPITIKSDVLNLTDGAEGVKVLSGFGATKQLEKADSGAIILFDRAAGEVFTLPASIPGMKFTFLVTVDLTAAAYAFVTDGAFLVGSLAIDVESEATGEKFFADGTTHVGVSMNKTTTGGLIGGCFHIECLTSTLWKIKGDASATATPADPYTT